MNWFTRLCRHTGLMIHHVAKPVPKQTHTVSHTTEEKQASDTVTLRRTTIDEIEIKQNTHNKSV